MLITFVCLFFFVCLFVCFVSFLCLLVNPPADLRQTGPLSPFSLTFRRRLCNLPYVSSTFFFIFFFKSFFFHFSVCFVSWWFLVFPSFYTTPLSLFLSFFFHPLLLFFFPPLTRFVSLLFVLVVRFSVQKSTACFQSFYSIYLFHPISRLFLDQRQPTREPANNFANAAVYQSDASPRSCPNDVAVRASTIIIEAAHDW